MSSVNSNLSEVKGAEVPNGKGFRIGIVWAEWNPEITEALRDGAIQTLLQNGVKEYDIVTRAVPGSFELTLGARWMADHVKPDAVICIGCVIQGETRHFDFICDAVAHGITELNILYGIPVIFGVLTPDNQQQALDRAGGKYGNKGDEAAVTALKMIALKRSLQ